MRNRVALLQCVVLQHALGLTVRFGYVLHIINVFVDIFELPDVHAVLYDVGDGLRLRVR